MGEYAVRIELSGARRVIGIVAGMLAACGLTDSEPVNTTASGGASSPGEGGRGGRGATLGGAPSGGMNDVQAGRDVGGAGTTSNQAGDSGGGGELAGGVDGNAGATSGGSAGASAGGPSGAAGEDPGSAGAAGSSSLVPVGRTGFAACGSIECPVQPLDTACCWNHESKTSECLSPETNCTWGKAVHTLRCDETADCPRRRPDEPTACVFDWRNGGGRAECAAPLVQPTLEASMVILQLCHPDAGSGDCGKGTCLPSADHEILSWLLPSSFYACY